MVAGVAGEDVIDIGGEVSMICRPCLMAVLAQHAANARRDVVVQEEAQREPPGG